MIGESALPAFRGKVLAQFLGDEEFPVEWASEDEKLQMWWYDDLHCPNPVSPLWFDVGGWWHTCDYLFRRFGFPIAVDWKAKNVNGYVYSAVVPADPEYGKQIGPYFGMVMPVYATNFLDWWRTKLRPEIERNFAEIDGYDDARATLPELMIHLEEALDIQERHWRIHWVLNLAQFQASLDLQAAIKETIGEVDGELLGKILVSDDDRNWDSIRELWEMKNAVAADPDLREAFEGATAQEVLRALPTAGASGGQFMARIAAYQREYGNRSMFAHEYIYPLWRENPAPIVETIKSYLETDYDYPSALQKLRETRDAAIDELFGRVPADAPGRERLREALDIALKMTPLTPDHHFYIDQGTYARLRLVFLAVGRKLAAAGAIGDPEDVFYLRYHEIRVLAADPNGLDGKAIVAERRMARDRAFQVRPREWVGTVTEWDLYTEPYKSLWGYPEKFHRGQAAPAETATIDGLPASAGVVEGTARVVTSSDEFDEVRQGDILVCKMTSPSWIVVFTKIKGLVTDAGGALSHPAVVSREFGIPAVVGTMVATERIKTGDRVRVNGTTGSVEILG